MTSRPDEGDARQVIALKVDTQHLKTEIEPLAAVHGVELVALEWLQGPGRGVLRLYIDRPGADPRTPPDERGPGATADVCARLSRDVSAVLDKIDEELIPMAYDLEVSSPGFERPVQKREDFERFKGLTLILKARHAIEGRGSFEGPITGTKDLPDGDYAVCITVENDRAVEVPTRNIARARLAEIKAPKPAKPPKAPRKNRPPTGAAQSTADHDVRSDATESAARDER